MKLRNKRTGEIANWCIDKDVIRTCDGSIVCNSLAEINEQWEDYEEPKDNNYWYIDDFGRIQFSSEVLDEIEGRPNNWMARKLFGNYFETKEEAEKAVEKLKAWKRLKDKGMKFGIYKVIGEYCVIRFTMTYPINYIEEKDINLLFGGEE